MLVEEGDAATRDIEREREGKRYQQKGNSGRRVEKMEWSDSKRLGRDIGEVKKLGEMFKEMKNASVK